MSTEVNRIYDELIALRSVIHKCGSPSDLVSFETNAAKCMLLSAASYFEKKICDMVISHVEDLSSSPTISALVQTQALNRRYHTLFNWEGNNINSFIRAFGSDFSEFMKDILSTDENRDIVKEFLFLGNQRNLLVHNNFSDFPLNMTLGDIKEKFDTAYELINLIQSSFDSFIKDFFSEKAD